MARKWPVTTVFDSRISIDAMLKPILAARAALATALVLTTACAEYEFAEQDISLRYLSKADQITLELDTRGLYALESEIWDSKASAAKTAKERLDRMAAGERFIYLLSFPLIFDLDAAPDESQGPGEDDWISSEDWERISSVFDTHVHLDEASMYLDRAGVLAIQQSFRLEHGAACIAALNELITLGVRHETASVDPEESNRDQMFASPTSRENLRSFMDAGGQWLTLTEKALEIRIPATPADLAVLLRGFATDSGQSPREVALASALFGGLDEVVVKQNVALLRFPVGGDGSIHWNLRAPRHEDAKVLVAAFGDDLPKARD